jgi:lipid-binding SYLF domain-containing protein
MRAAQWNRVLWLLLVSVNMFSADTDEILENAASALQRIYTKNKQDIPAQALDKASCIGIFPSGKTSKQRSGIVSCRTPKGWSVPLLTRLEGSGVDQDSDLLFLGLSGKVKQILLSGQLSFEDLTVKPGLTPDALPNQLESSLDSDLLTYLVKGGVLSGVLVSRVTLIADKTLNADLYRAIIREDVSPAHVGSSNLLSRFDALRISTEAFFQEEPFPPVSKPPTKSPQDQLPPSRAHMPGQEEPFPRVPGKSTKPPKDTSTKNPSS